MRLIDADELLHCFNDLEGSNDELNWMLNVVIPDVIQDQPTAYDIDKVVEEFDKKYNNSLWIKGDEEFSITRNELIEVVKQGGVSEAEQKLKEMESE